MISSMCVPNFWHLLGCDLSPASYICGQGLSFDSFSSVFPQSQSFTKEILRLVNRVGNNVDRTKELYERPSVLKTRSLSMVLDRQVPSRIGNKALEYQGSKVTLPSPQELIGDDGKNQEYLSTQVRLTGTFFCFEDWKRMEYDESRKKIKQRKHSQRL